MKPVSSAQTEDGQLGTFAVEFNYEIVCELTTSESRQRHPVVAFQLIIAEGKQLG